MTSGGVRDGGVKGGGRGGLMVPVYMGRRARQTGDVVSEVRGYDSGEKQRECGGGSTKKGGAEGVEASRNEFPSRYLGRIPACILMHKTQVLSHCKSPSRTACEPIVPAVVVLPLVSIHCSKALRVDLRNGSVRASGFVPQTERLEAPLRK